VVAIGTLLVAVVTKTTTTVEPKLVVALSVRLLPVDLIERLVITLEGTTATLVTMIASLDRTYKFEM